MDFIHSLVFCERKISLFRSAIITSIVWNYINFLELLIELKSTLNFNNMTLSFESWLLDDKKKKRGNAFVDSQ